MLDRNVTNLVLVIPGAQLNSWQHGISENPQQGINVNVNGQVFPLMGSCWTAPKITVRFSASL